MYNAHRGMVPAPNSRLSELLDQLRQEFENQSRSTGEFEHQCVYKFLFLLVLHPCLVLSLLPISCCDCSCFDDAVVLRHFRDISPLSCLKALTELPVEFPG